MPKWIHRTTLDVLDSVPEAELPEPARNYIEAPDLSQVKGQPKKYWEIANGQVQLKSPLDRAQADADELIIQRRDRLRLIDDVDSAERQIVQLLLSEINELRALHSLPPRTLTEARIKLRQSQGA